MVLRRRMQIVAKTETGATYSMISKCNGENQLYLTKYHEEGNTRMY
jgi:hypothetical protein